MPYASLLRIAAAKSTCPVGAGTNHGPRSQTTAPQQRLTLPNGWSLSPIGKSLPLGDLPLTTVVSPNGKRLAVTNNGQSTQTLQLVDITGEKVLSETVISKSWVGLCFTPDGKRLLASGGNDNRVLIYDVSGDKLVKTDSVVLGKPWPNRISVAGLATDKTGQTFYAVTKDDSSLYVCDLGTRQIRERIKLPAEAYTCRRSPVSDELYITVWGADKVVVFDPKTNKLTGEIATGSHPNDLAFSNNGKYLYVANANDNTVTVIDVKARRVLESLNTALYPDAPAGSTPNGLALSADGKTLLVANADNNCLATFDVSQPGRSRSLGFIPTGWYPTSVQVVGKKVLVANGKGFSSQANPAGPNPYKRRESDTQYIGGLFKGTLSLFAMPTPTQLTGLTRQVYANTPYTKEREKTAVGANWPANSPIPKQVGAKTSPIKHVFYIIKENRTYDQVFGDMKEGNGDTSLCLFPENVTPNQHALAREFVLLDNFYVDAEVSADGHNWSTAAYATDYVEKTWPTSYGGRGGTYDYEGSRPVAFPKRGFIWDYCKRAGIRYRSYGEFEAYSKRKNSALAGLFAPNYPDYDLGVKDIDRVEVWKHDLDSLIKINAVPNFSSIRLGNDHTSGARIGARTPAAFVADNDLAVGRFVEYLSKSPIWNESAVFVLEDDAQNGSDHVDAHRSPALVISPYTKRHHVEHTSYTTSGMLRTIELILGLPPMSQYDAGARPMYALFTDKADLTTYDHRPAQIDLDAKNTAMTEPARQSEKLDLRYADKIDDRLFNEIIWKAVRGEHAVMPAPRRGAFLTVSRKDDDDDD
ncbi:bifunctional YncE family protein/alkaline phosphatase family protein [Spirosoma rhododendri]|uniref:Bifunctional YncE family protein/alkaline phosphatase family protein n=1 Tax=Spirosoma rhododendri TaxID=2728024 RepID=A0A7L5DGJ4_9BACT|nr:bifunctional YncE family protein/alkaline phosphatase family protein [Spirosoma rhododendri]QJD77366.1 bifunctional YncE family protein/alkaline phosphatase family protein [Spirosoma rhododendri]